MLARYADDVAAALRAAARGRPRRRGRVGGGAARDDPPRDPRRPRPGRAGARRAGRARARPAWRSATSTRTPSSTRSTARPASCRRCRTCARRPAARSSTSPPPSWPTTGTCAGAPGTRPWSSRRGGRTLRVRPPWEAPQPGTIDVAIEPAQAFGTGAHETTRLSLALLMELEPARRRWPTGAAAPACWRSRRPSSASARCSACDVEAASVAATRDGARDNGVEVEVSRCDLRRAPGPWAPTVTANLVRPLLLEVAARPGAPARAAGGLRPAARRGRRGRRRVRGARHDGDGPEGGLGMERAAAGGTGDRLRGRAGRRAADRGARAPHAGADLARARRGDRARRCS